jgi:uncharacterized protein Veg
MIKRIDFGKTSFNDLHQVFKYATQEEFESKRSRLFPNGNSDNEVATTSIFLSSLCAVKEYREELLSEIGVKKIKNQNINLHAYTELENMTTEERPDGLLVVTSGKLNPIIEWACFVEVKVGSNQLEESQVDRYATFAREIGINNIITISNELVTCPLDSPIKLRKRSFNLYHWSWAFLKISALRLVRANALGDSDHIFILQELRKFIDGHKKLSNYVNMGKEWKDAVTKAHSHGIEQKVDLETLGHIVDSYVQEEKDVSLQLTAKSGIHIELLTKGDRKEEIAKMMQSKKVITSQFMLEKDRHNTFFIDVDFIRQEVRCYTHISISTGKSQAQTTKLIKMFEEDSGYTDSILVNAYYIRNRGLKNDVPLSVLINEKAQAEHYSVLDKSFGDEVKFFEVKTKDLLGRDFKSTKNFIIKLESVAYRFLTQVAMYQNN